MKKVVFITTLNAIRAMGPCEDGWKKLLKHLGKEKANDEPLNLLTILESNGVQHCLWALRCVEHPDLDRIARLMAADFAEAVLPIFEKKYPKDDRPRKAIQAARDFANGKITAQERAAAGDAARAAAAHAAGDAARAAAWAAAGAAAWAAARAAAGAAAWAAAGDAARAAAWDAARAAAGAAAWAAAGAAQTKIIRKYLGR